VFKVHDAWVCPTCDSMYLWPAMEGADFYDQDGDQDA
jgi:hypothetical protein